ncbi:MAG: DUF1456 family protein [Spirochaetales bacterium]|nr:DUF1456 family protein [Spirochaetales bacterium]
MDNNSILIRLRYILSASELDISRIFAKNGYEISEERVTGLLKKEGEDGFIECNDEEMINFLDGLIITKRGPSDKKHQPTTKLNNNVILRKLKIAFNLRDEDIIAALDRAEFRITKSELSAFFRGKDSRQYRPCGDQFLRRFLKGLSTK